MSQLKGYIFGCTVQTEQECLKKCLFGQWESKLSEVEQLESGDYLFLYNFNTRQLKGIFTATSKGALRIDPTAWRTSRNALTPFPAQIKVNKPTELVSLPEDLFLRILEPNYQGTDRIMSYKLSSAQVRRLLMEMHKFSKSNKFYPPEKFAEVDQALGGSEETVAQNAPSGPTIYDAGVQSMIQDLQQRLSTQENQNLVVLGQMQSDLEEQEERFKTMIADYKQEFSQQFNKFKWELQDEVDDLKKQQDQLFKVLVSNMKEINNKVGLQSKNGELQKRLKQLNQGVQEIENNFNSGIQTDHLLQDLQSTPKQSVTGSSGYSGQESGVQQDVTAKKGPSKGLNLFDI